jgi:hypothetical protein
VIILNRAEVVKSFEFDEVLADGRLKLFRYADDGGMDI